MSIGSVPGLKDMFSVEWNLCSPLRRPFGCRSLCTHGPAGCPEPPWTVPHEYGGYQTLCDTLGAGVLRTQNLAWVFWQQSGASITEHTAEPRINRWANGRISATGHADIAPLLGRMNNYKEHHICSALVLQPEESVPKFRKKVPSEAFEIPEFWVRVHLNYTLHLIYEETEA